MQIAQRGCGCLISGGVHGQVGWDPGQPDLVVGNWMIFKIPSKLSRYYDSMITLKICFIEPVLMKETCEVSLKPTCNRVVIYYSCRIF